MYSIRCLCGKIVCQVDHMSYLPRVEEGPQSADGPAIVILCRHCHRYMVLRTPTITDISFTSNPSARSGTVVATHPEGVHLVRRHQCMHRLDPGCASACPFGKNPARPTAAHASPSFCANCHNSFQHPAGWVGSHGDKVDASCSTCHATSSQSGGHNACSECHTASGEWHPEMWFVAHARAVAAEGEAGCVRCHDHVEPSCSKCHRSR